MNRILAKIAAAFKSEPVWIHKPEDPQARIREVTRALFALRQGMRVVVVEDEKGDFWTPRELFGKHGVIVSESVVFGRREVRFDEAKLNSVNGYLNIVERNLEPE